MWNLPHIFTSGALFQAEAPLTLRGTVCPHGDVTGELKNSVGAVACTKKVVADEEGRFTLTLHTPTASFEEHSLQLTSGADTLTLDHILFGELWLASGQSNMEMVNGSIPKSESMYDAVADKRIRVYHVDYLPQFGSADFPWEPDPLNTGRWIAADDREGLSGVSACGLQFVSALYDFLNVKKDVPVGFLNASWGGTPMSAWIPRDAIEQDAAIAALMKQHGHYPEKERWNTLGDTNFIQPSCQYNVKIAPLEGLKFRGMIWYQGESDCNFECVHPYYADYLRFYHRIYRERFAADPARFLMISSLIYPWIYGESGECKLGYLNDAFVQTATESPDKFAYVPIGDLEPIWIHHQSNHPIHPGHKYAVGARLFQIAAARVYGHPGQQAPAYLKSCERTGNRLRLRFDSVGTGLYVAGKVAHGLYVAGADGVYLPAAHTILSPDTLEVWCDAIPEPCHAAYGVQSMEPRCNVFAGAFPLTPFFTNRADPIRIEARPWYDTAVSAVWAGQRWDEVLDVFFHPVWEPLAASQVCRDSAFCHESEASVRVCGEQDAFGCFVRAYPYNRLDLQRYAGLQVELYNTAHLRAKLVLVTDEGETAFPLEPVQEPKDGWQRFEARFGELSPAEIRRMEFRFCQTDTPYRFVNLERPRLLK